MADVVLRDYPLMRERYYEIRRDGLPVIYLIPKKRSTCYVTLRVGVGSFDRYYRENGRIVPALPGCAHFLEHKLFANPDGSDAMERFGDLGADANAYTNGTSTCYLFNCRDRFAEALRELFYFVSHPFFTWENVEAEKQIILQEAAMYADSPFSKLQKEAIRQLYASHPIRDEIVGTPGSIKRITPARLYRFYRAFYHASNMQLFVSGDLTPEEVLAALSDVSIPTREEAFRVLPAFEAGRGSPSVRTVRREVSKPLFAVSSGFPEPAGDIRERQKKYFAAGVAAAYLFSSSGTLYEELKKTGLVSAPLRQSLEWDPGVCFLSVTGKSDRPRKVFDMIRESVREALANGIPQEDFSRIARAQYAGYVSSFDDEENLVDAFCELIPLGIDAFEAGEVIASVEADYANAVLREYFSPDRLNLTVVRAPRNKTITEDEE